jgi:hypothetical protein
LQLSKEFTNRYLGELRSNVDINLDGVLGDPSSHSMSHGISMPPLTPDEERLQREEYEREQRDIAEDEQRRVILRSRMGGRPSAAPVATHHHHHRSTSATVVPPTATGTERKNMTGNHDDDEDPELEAQEMERMLELERILEEKSAVLASSFYSVFSLYKSTVALVLIHISPNRLFSWFQWIHEVVMYHHGHTLIEW